MNKPPLFLDTTIQIERVVGSRARQAALQQELIGYRLITSTYVLGEYLRTIVKDAVHLHRLLTQQAYLDDLMTTIGQHPNKREASRMMLMVGALLRLEQPLSASESWNAQSRLDLLDRLARYIEISLPGRFMLGIDELLNTTDCGLAKERPIAFPLPATFDPSYRLRSQCVRTVRECELAELLAVQWRPALEAVANGLSQMTDPILARMGQLARQVCTDPTVARGRNCTWYLGDLIIALELPDNVPLYTTNRRHFAPLLEILGKKLHVVG